MGDDKIGGPENAAVIRGATLTSLRRCEKLALIGYRMATDSEAEDYQKLLDATAAANMEEVATIAVTKGIAKGQGEAFFAMAELLRALQNGDEIKKGGIVGAIIRYEREAAKGSPGSEVGTSDRSGGVEEQPVPSSS